MPFLIRVVERHLTLAPYENLVTKGLSFWRLHPSIIRSSDVQDKLKLVATHLVVGRVLEREICIEAPRGYVLGEDLRPRVP